MLSDDAAVKLMFSFKAPLRNTMSTRKEMGVSLILD
jgi:hypothetical protein